MRIVFAGTPEFAAASLQALLTANLRPVAVYSQPDRPAGRGRGLQASPVKKLALDASISVCTPESLRRPDAQAELRAFAPDLLIVVAYGLILPKKVLAIPRHGCWNVHGSLLPRWRGAAPIQRAIEAGDTETGVGLMQMEAGLDTGPVMIERKINILDTDTAQSLHDRLALLGAEVLVQGVIALQNGSLPSAQPQSELGVTYAHKLEKSEAVLDWQAEAAALGRKIRAFVPFPIAEAQLLGERVQILEAQALSIEHNAAPGSVVQASKTGIDIACGSGALRLLALKREGGKVIRAADYLNARPELRNLSAASGLQR